MFENFIGIVSIPWFLVSLYKFNQKKDMFSYVNNYLPIFIKGSLVMLIMFAYVKVFFKVPILDAQDLLERNNLLQFKNS